MPVLTSFLLFSAEHKKTPAHTERQYFLLKPMGHTFSLLDQLEKNYSSSQKGN